MKRRNFIKTVGLSAVGLGLSGSAIGRVFAGSGITQIADNDRILVLLRLNGGNDGLNTVIPLDQYTNLVTQRSNIIIPYNQLIEINNKNQDLAFHPSMSGMKSVFENDQLSIIQNVAADSGGNRSHFRVTDMWMTGINDQSHPQQDQGWLGRVFDKEYVGFPAGYPNAVDTDPFAVSISYSASHTCEGDLANYAHAVVDPANAINLTGGTVVADGTANADLQAHLSTLAGQSNAWNTRITSAINLGTSMSTLYSTHNLSQAFQKVAKMISGGLKTRIYTIDIGGFDTHSNQVDGADPSLGSHANLWNYISTALTAFQEDLNLMGLQKRVATMTFSEFGRQVASNGSLGTDHGEASCMFLMGDCIQNGIIGDNPTIDSVVTNGAALPMQIDIRDIQASVLKHWFGIPESIIDQNFEYYGGITYYPIIDPCEVTPPVLTGTDELETVNREMKLYPNPCTDRITLEAVFPEGNVLIKIQDLSGKEVKTIEQHFSHDQKLTLPLTNLDFGAGNYVLSVYTEKRSHNKRELFVKLGQ